MKRFITVMVILAMLFFPLTALAGKTKVTVRVDGLSCPFCAYGIEKKLKRMAGVEEFLIDIEGGKVEITFKDSEYVRVEKIEETVKEAGFTPRKIDVEEIGD